MTDPTGAEQTMIRNLEKNTGKSLEQWVKLAKSEKTDKHGELVGLLKSKHGLTHGYANLVAHKAKGSDAASSGGGDLVEAQYGGKKNELRPIFDTLVRKVEEFGSDVEIAPKKSYVSLRRSKQFGLIQPSTTTRVDVGINLGSRKPSARLEKSGSFNSMVSHRVRVENVAEVDEELVSWLREAYENS